MALCYQQIRADQIVDNVENLDELRTFGWSLSSGVDVDNNNYSGEGGSEVWIVT